METSSSTDRGATASAKNAATEAKERVRAEGERVVGAARREAQSFAKARRDFAGDYLRDVSDALESATATLDERGRTSTAHYVGIAADQVQTMSDRVHRQDVQKVVHEIENFARTRPALFFGGAFLLGFAATRIVTDRPEPAGVEATPGDIAADEFED